MIGGGLSYQGQGLIKHIQDDFLNGVFGGAKSQRVDLKIATLKNDAGFIGAACL